MVVNLVHLGFVSSSIDLVPWIVIITIDYKNLEHVEGKYSLFFEAHMMLYDV